MNDEIKNNPELMAKYDEKIANDIEMRGLFEAQPLEGQLKMLGVETLPNNDGDDGGAGGDGEQGGSQQQQQQNNNDGGIDFNINENQQQQQKVDDEGKQQQQQQKQTDQGVADQRADVLNEIFGGRFKTVQEAQLANIPAILDEVNTLRQSNADLQAKLDKKPKTLFVNDNVAKFNEFVKDTGINNYTVFNKLNNSEVEKMDDLDVLVMQYILDNPDYTGSEATIRGHFERKYGLNILKDKDVEDMEPEERQKLEQQLEDNKFIMSTDVRNAKKSLGEMKGKIKMPEIPEEDPNAKPKGKTQEELQKIDNDWKKAQPVIGKNLSKINIPIKVGDKIQNFLSYELSEDEQNELGQLAYDFAIKNQMELNQESATQMMKSLQERILIDKFPDIAHAIFERATKMTEKEQKEMYHNPSAKENRNNDKPPSGGTPQATEFEQSQRNAYQMELKD